MGNWIIIGLVGPIASGKGVIAEHLRIMDYTYQSLSDRVREETIRLGLESSRVNLQNVGNQLRKQYGPAVLAERTVKLLKSTKENTVIDSIRNPSELSYLRNNLKAIIIGVDAPEELRLKWYLDRARERGEDPATSKDFFTANLRDLGIGEDQSGQQVSACLAMADYIIHNTGSKQELCDQLIEIISSNNRRLK